MVGAFFFFSFTVFFSFSSGREVEEGSLVSGHVCFRTPPEGAELADSDTNRFIKSRAGAISSQQSDKWWADVEPAGSAAGPPIWKWSSLMDRDVHPTSPRARPPLHPPSFVFVTACFLLCTATGRLFVKVTAGVRSRLFFRKTLSCRKSSDVGPEMCDVCRLPLLKKRSVLTSYSIISSVVKCCFYINKFKRRLTGGRFNLGKWNIFQNVFP